MALKRWIGWAALGCLAIVILIPTSPHWRPVPDPDPSVYLYVADQMLDGKAPYVDAWDHKQPLTYLLYAAGLWAGNRSLWGVWILQAGLFAVTGIAAGTLARRLTPAWLSGLIGVGALLTVLALLDGFSVEFMALPFQVLSMTAYHNAVAGSPPRGRRWAWALAAGILCGLTFFLKQNLIGVGLAIFAMLLAGCLRRNARANWLTLGAFGLGAALVAAGMLAYLASRGAVSAYWSAAFEFNLEYSRASLFTQIRYALDALETAAAVPGLWITLALWVAALVLGLLRLTPVFSRAVRQPWLAWALTASGAGLTLASLGWELVASKHGLGIAQITALAIGIGAAGLGIFLIDVARRERFDQRLVSARLLAEPSQVASDGARWSLLALGLLAFPIQVFLIGLSGRSYTYYFLPLVPLGILLAGTVGGMLFRPSQRVENTIAGAALALGLFAALAYGPLLQLIGWYSRPPDAKPAALLASIAERTTPGDTIYVWGMAADVYVLSQRFAPTPYFYLAPVYQETYNSDHQVFQHLLADLQARPPTLWLDPVTHGLQIDLQACQAGSAGQAGWDAQLQAFLCQNYEWVDTLDGYQIFQRITDS